MAKIDDAKQDYLNGMKYKDIATKYDVSINTVKSWRTRHKWRKKGAPPLSKKGAPLRNKYAAGNKGGGAPSGNKNAVTTGEYETITAGALTDEEQAIFNQVTDDPMTTINTQIRELKVRQFRIQKRIKLLQDSGKAESDKVIGFTISKGSNKPQSTGGTVTEHRKIDDMIKLEYALTSVNNSLLRATHEKQHMIESLSSERRRLLHAEAIKADAEAAKVQKDGSGLAMQESMSKMSAEELRRLASGSTNDTTK